MRIHKPVREEELLKSGDHYSTIGALWPMLYGHCKHYPQIVSSPAPPSGWSERERRRVWEITQGGSVQRAEIPRQVLIMKVGLNYKVQNRSGGSLASQTR